MSLRMFAVSAALGLTVVGTQPTPAGDCPVTAPNHHAPPVGSEPLPPGAAPFWHGNSSVGTSLWPEGRVVFRPDGPGAVLTDGALRMKFLWLKRRGLPAHITGHRLDDNSVHLRAEVREEFTPQGIQPSFLIFPTPGCWLVTATVGSDTLSFVTAVIKIGNGPARATAGE